MQKQILPLICVHLLGAILVAQVSAAKTTQEIVAAAKPSVVIVRAWDTSKRGLKIGTGFFIADRQVTTNHHVIKGAGTIQIIALDGTDLGFLAIKADDPKTDLAILTSVLSRLVLEFAGAATDGRPVVVIGNPAELEGTVSTGVVSTAERTPLEFQINAPVSPGSSGSPVLDEEGKVLGMIREIKTSGQNLNFAIRASDSLNKPGSDPIEERKARRSAEAFVRRARALFGKKVILELESI